MPEKNYWGRAREIWTPWIKAVKIAMIEKDIDQGMISEATGYCQADVSMTINGRPRTEEMVRKIGEYLGVPY